NTPITVPITVGSAGGAAGLVLTGSSSNTALVPNGNLIFGGSGANRTVTITPAFGQMGATTITGTGTDRTGSTSRTFAFSVSAARLDGNGDGRSDIQWRNTISGHPITWFMDGTNVIGGTNPGPVDLSWQIVGRGDFNGDGRSDILWRHSSGALFA